jgi:hypothetical protein
MKLYNPFDDDMFVVNSAIKNKLGSREEIELYQELQLALDLMNNNDDEFEVRGSSIGNGLEFDITVPYPKPLPEKIGQLFFNISPKFSVDCKETNTYLYEGNKHFHIKIKKI